MERLKLDPFTNGLIISSLVVLPPLALRPPPAKCIDSNREPLSMGESIINQLIN
jgi:hypothetical protein